MKKNKPNFELLREAYAIIDGIPEKSIALHAILAKRGKSLDCGTIACAAGWLAHHPTFNFFGLGCDKEGSLTYNGESNFSYRFPLEMIFNISNEDVANLFGSRTISKYDGDLTDNASDKEVWKHRIRQFLLDNGQKVKS